MTRCYECSNMEGLNREPYAIEHHRIWPSGIELIALADRGCDLCLFIRKAIENVSEANVRRINNKHPIVLQECNHRIFLSFYGFGAKLTIQGCDYQQELKFNAASFPFVMQAFALNTPYDPVMRAREFFKACLLGDRGTHDHCRPRIEGSTMKAISLPRRLLDLSHADIVPTLDTQAWIATNRATVDELSRYCTLSYQWGKRPFACTLSTQPTADRILFFVSMPQTFQDAIIVARGLKIRFLWIDALCIVQPGAHGDYTDWNAEGPRMWLVYQNSMCTISATCSDNPDDGFLRKVGTDWNPPCRIPAQEPDDQATEFERLYSLEPRYICTGDGTDYASIITSTLSRRGWVAQERLLSRRILHFSEEGVFWECQAYKSIGDNDGGSNAIGPLVGRHMGSCHASLLTVGNWLRFIEFYSISKFTFEKDRLIALSSIAKSVSAERFGHEYFAGIWSKHLALCLSWRSKETCTSQARESCLAIAPSWSWASVPGQIGYTSRWRCSHMETSETLVQIKQVRMSPSDGDQKLEDAEKGTLQLSARVCYMSLPTRRNGWQVSTEVTCNADADIISECSREYIEDRLMVKRTYMKGSWDEIQDQSTAGKTYAVVPISVVHDDDRGESRYSALILTLLRSADDKGGGSPHAVYRRAGYGEWTYYWLECMDDSDYPEKPEPGLMLDTLFPDAALQTIEIV